MTISMSNVYLTSDDSHVNIIYECIYIGYYVYMEASGQLLGQSAALLSVPMTTSSVGICMSWWYHMYGADIDRLNVYALRSGGSDNLEWVRTGNQGNDWMQGQVYVTGDFTVSFSIFMLFSST